MDAVELISLYNTLFYVFLGIAVLGLALGIFFFFYFDIPMVYSMITGKSKEKAILRIQKQNAKTGNLRFQYPDHTGDIRTGRTGRTGQSKRQARSERLSKNGNSGKLAKEAAESAVNDQVAQILEQAAETAVLQTQEMETSILQPVAAQSSQESELGQTEMLQPGVAVNFRFEVTQANVLIHTEEKI